MKTKNFLLRYISTIVLLALTLINTGSVFAAPLREDVCLGIGDGASSAQVKQAMCDAFLRNGGFPSVGNINTNTISKGKVHNWAKSTVENPNDYQIQDFDGNSSDDVKGATLIYTPAKQKAYFVRGQVLMPYLELGDWDVSNGVKSWLGGPIADIGSTPSYYFHFKPGQIGFFERGFIAENKTMGWSAHTYYPSICDVKVSVTKDGSTSKLTASTTATRSFGFPDANDDFQVYFVIVFSDGRREWRRMNELTLTTFSIEWPDLKNDVQNNDIVHFYLDAWAKDNKYSSYPSDIVLNPSHIDINHHWYGTTDPLYSLDIKKGTIAPALKNDNFLCNTGSGFPILPDLWIKEVNISQTINNFDINNDGRFDIVNGKSFIADVMIDFDQDFFSTVSDDTEVKVRLDGPNGYTDTQTVTKGQIMEAPWGFEFIVPASGAGNFEVTAKVDPENIIREKREGNNSSTKLITIREAPKLTTLHVIGEYKNEKISNFDSFVDKNAEYMETQFPILLTPSDDIKFDTPIILGFDEKNKEYDDITVWSVPYRLVQKITNNKVNEASNNAAIYVPNSFMTRYFPSSIKGADTLGITYSGSSILFVTSSQYPSVLAHEMIHIYQPEDTAPHTNSDVDGGASVNRSGQVVFGGPFNLMNEFIYPNSWISKDDYKHIWTSISPGTPDPEILVITGQILADGSAQLFPADFYPTGFEDIGGGDHQIVFLNLKGSAVYKNTFVVGKVLSNGAVLKNPVFTFTSAFPDAAIYVQILDKNKKVLVKANMHTKLLRDAIVGLPDKAFSKNPSQSRNALLNQINALEKQYKVANLNGIYNHLVTIRKITARWLKPKYDNPNALGYDYENTLYIMDELIQRVKIMLPKNGK